MKEKKKSFLIDLVMIDACDDIFNHALSFVTGIEEA